MEYFIILMIFLASALILEWKFHFHLYKTMKERLIVTGIILVLCMIWDFYATWKGHWSFAGPGLLGIKIFWVPIEEFLFAIIMPYWAITIYKLVHEKLKVR